MSALTHDLVLTEAFGPEEGTAKRIKQAALVALGIAFLALTAKVQMFLPGNPVPITLTTFGVLTIGATYGAGLGLITVAGYLVVGALGFDVFAGSSAEKAGLVYMMGGTGGYLVGYVLAAAALGMAARRRWDRSFLGMATAMVVGNALIYVPGLLWLSTFAESWSQTLAWGLTPFLLGDLLKLLLAAILVPALWHLTGRAR